MSRRRASRAPPTHPDGPLTRKVGIETVLGWVVGVDEITPLEVMRREVIPAAAELVAA